MGLKLTTSIAFFALFAVLSSVPTPSLAARIIVGGSQHWHFGFNYSEWATYAAPFHQNDTLVFMYDPPNGTTFPHNVYKLKNRRRYLNCNLKNATVVGTTMQGGGKGLEFVLRKREPHYFACGIGNGFHCRAGLMKFEVLPIRPCY